MRVAGLIKQHIRASNAKAFIHCLTRSAVAQTTTIFRIPLNPQYLPKHCHSTYASTALTRYVINPAHRYICHNSPRSLSLTRVRRTAIVRQYATRHSPRRRRRRIRCLGCAKRCFGQHVRREGRHFRYVVGGALRCSIPAQEGLWRSLHGGRHGGRHGCGQGNR